MAVRTRRERETTDYLVALRRLIRRAGERVADADEVELRMLLALRGDLTSAERTAVDGQRARGASWAYVAQAAGTTRQAAWERWGARQPSAAETKDVE